MQTLSFLRLPAFAQEDLRRKAVLAVLDGGEVKAIAKMFGVTVSFSVSTVGRYLRRWGLTPQKPAKRAYQRDPVACKRWMEEEYPAIRRQANREKATILWGDECGFRSDHQTGTSYSRRGKTPVIPSTGERFRCNMVSAIDNSGHLYFKMFDGSFTIPVFLDFLQRLVNQSKRKVFLVVDNLSVHKSQAVS